MCPAFALASVASAAREAGAAAGRRTKSASRSQLYVLQPGCGAALDLAAAGKHDPANDCGRSGYCSVVRLRSQIGEFAQLRDGVCRRPNLGWSIGILVT